MVKKIILVFKTHFDIGFTDLAENVIHGYGTDMLRQVIETCNATKNLGKLRYVWTMPAWPLWYICRNCDPGLKPELDRLIREGQIVWHGLPFTSHTDFAAPDEYAEVFRYARELAEHYQKPMPLSAKMTDVPGHGRMLPEMLTQAGIRFLHLGCNEFATPPQVPGLFFWQGSGGGRVLTMYSKGGYGTGLLPPEGWPYPVWMALMHTHDNCGPQSAELILKMVEKARKSYPDAEIVCGSMDDFYRELEKCDLSSVPVVDKDLADTWIHGVGSYPEEVRLLRACRERARGLHREYLAQLLSGKNPDRQIEPLWDRYYEAVALFEEHTWGADVKTWLGPNRVYEKEEFLGAKSGDSYRFMEQSWQEQRTRVQQTKRCLDEIQALLRVSPPVLAQDGTRPLEAVQNGKNLTVENDKYRLVLNTETGGICTLWDREEDCAVLKAGEESILAYRYDRYGLPDVTEFLRSYAYHFTTWGIQDYGRENYPDCEHKTFYPDFLGWEMVGRSLRLCYGTGKSSEDYGDARKIQLTVTFPEQGDSLEILLELQEKQESPFIESGSLLFPFPGKVSYQIGKPGGVVNPETEIASCANQTLFNLEREVTVLTDNGSVSICSPDAPLFGIGEPGIYRFRKDFGEDRPAVLYFNLFNNMWGTNFPQWIGGSFRYRFLLRSASAEEAAKAPAWAAKVCADQPMGAPENCTIPEEMELLSCRRGRDAIFIGLRDLAGRDRAAMLRLPGYRIQEVNLLHEPKSPAGQDECTFPVRPWGMHLFAIQKEGTCGAGTNEF